MNIPDFAVSSQEAGFDEFLRLINRKEKLNYTGNNKYYGYRNGQLEIDDHVWTTNIIKPHQAIALLTGKQLTEGEQLTDKSKHKLLYSNLTKDFTWCGVCNEHFHNSEGYHDVKLLPTQESVKGEINSLQSLDDAIKLVSPFGTASISNPKVRQAIHDWNIKQTAHFQQELKEAKEKIEKLQFMIDNGLGNQDMLNDIYPVHRP